VLLKNGDGVLGTHKVDEDTAWCRWS